ncbi:nitrogen fixation negative regulator NifL [Vibrio maritimus]|uniref:nitrogen fixation negative regulator NifL n=1 Tax=Vibrio maritimus TaxID=990268 RepID=UPI0037358880
MIPKQNSNLTEGPETTAMTPSALFGSAIFKHIVSNAPVAIAITDSTGNMCEVNQCFTVMTGYDREALIGSNCSMLSYQTTPKEVYQALWRTISSGNTWQGRLVNRRKDRSLYIAELTITPFISDCGQTFYYTIQKDVTEQHRLEVEQQNHVALFEQVLSSAPIAMGIIDSQDRIIFSNDNYSKLAQSLSIDPMSKLSKHLECQCGQPSITQYLTDSLTNSQTLCLDEDREPNERWLEYILKTVPYSDIATEAYFDTHTSYCTIIGIIDRTKEKKQVEEKRITTISHITSDNKYVHTLQEVMMATQHQLQGPLNMIESATTILKQNNHACPGLTAMDSAMASAQHALQELKRAIPERQPEALQPVNINQLLADAIAMNTKILIKSSTEVTLNLTSDLPSISGKPYRLLLAFDQLIENAVDAIQQAKQFNGQLLITTEQNDDEVIVSFEDNGCGIPLNMRHRVFQPFHSSKPAIKSGCHGIGLTIVQQVVNDHSASLTIDSSCHDSGTVFRLIFPTTS